MDDDDELDERVKAADDALEREVQLWLSSDRLNDVTVPADATAKSSSLSLWRSLNLSSKFPMLALVARVVFGVPASEIPCERLFSRTARIMTFDRTLLSGMNVRDLVLLNANAKIARLFEKYT